MKVVICIMTLAVLMLNSSVAQDVFFGLEVTNDTVLMGNPVGVKYTIKNTQGDFEPPDFHNFDLIGGPNVSSQFSMINGTVTQSSSYEYILMPKTVGSFTISPASLINGEESIASEEVAILILENPEGIRQSSRGYGVSKSIVRQTEQAPLSKSDSLKMKLKKVKARKI